MREAGHADPRWLGVLTAALEAQARYHRLKVEGLEKIPEGAALLVGNHNAGAASLDALFVARYYRERGFDAPIYMLAHEFLFRRLGLRAPLERLGVVPANPNIAEQLLRRGEKVLVFPGSDLDSMRPWSARARVTFGAHRGFARLAIKTGVPVFPVANAGAHEAFVVLHQGRHLAEATGWKRLTRWHSLPLVWSLPWGFTWGPLSYLPYVPLPTQVTVRVCDRIDPDTRGSTSSAQAIDAVHRETVGALRAALAELYRDRVPIIG